MRQTWCFNNVSLNAKVAPAAAAVTAIRFLVWELSGGLSVWPAWFVLFCFCFLTSTFQRHACGNMDIACMSMS